MRLMNVCTIALLAACAPGDSGTADTSARAGSTTASQPAPAPEPDMRIEVDLTARQLYVVRGGTRVATHPVAVGSTEWPTQTGE